MSSHLIAMAYISKERMAEQHKAAELNRQRGLVSQKKARERSLRKWVGRAIEAGLAFLPGEPDDPTPHHGSIRGTADNM